MSVGVGARGRGGLAPPLLDAVDGVHVYLHVLARLEALAAHGARVRQLARRVHVEDVLLEVAVVAVELAALRARGLAGLTVSGAGAEGALVRGARLAPARSWGNDSRQFGVRAPARDPGRANFHCCYRTDSDRNYWCLAVRSVTEIAVACSSLIVSVNY